MSYTEELKKHIASLFDKSTDQEVIKQYALVENEIGKLDEVLNQKDAKEMELLKEQIREKLIPKAKIRAL